MGHGCTRSRSLRSTSCGRCSRASAAAPAAAADLAPTARYGCCRARVERAVPAAAAVGTPAHAGERQLVVRARHANQRDAADHPARAHQGRHCRHDAVAVSQHGRARGRPAHRRDVPRVCAAAPGGQRGVLLLNAAPDAHQRVAPVRRHGVALRPLLRGRLQQQQQRRPAERDVPAQPRRAGLQLARRALRAASSHVEHHYYATRLDGAGFGAVTTAGGSGGPPLARVTYAWHDSPEGLHISQEVVMGVVDVGAGAPWAPRLNDLIRRQLARATGGDVRVALAQMALHEVEIVGFYPQWLPQAYRASEAGA